MTAFSAKGWAPTATSGERVGFAYVYDEQGTLMGEYGAGGAKSTGSRQYVWLPTPTGPMPVATIQDGTTVQSVTADHLNTPRRVSSADGSLLWQWPYSAFGEEQPTVAQRRFATTGAVEGDLEFNLRYPGQYFDKESKLHYNGFRTYDPLTGRYTQGDPIGLNGGANRFGYAGGNPLNFADPTGLCIGPLAVACAYALVNAPWIVPASVAAIEAGAMMASGSASPSSLVPSSVSLVRPVAQAANAFMNSPARQQCMASARQGINFSAAAAKHMENPGRYVPLEMLEQAIKQGEVMPDPRGSTALMYTMEMWRNNTLYDLEVLYNQATNTIYHFQYSR